MYQAVQIEALPNKGGFGGRGGKWHTGRHSEPERLVIVNEHGKHVDIERERRGRIAYEASVKALKETPATSDEKGYDEFRDWEQLDEVDREISCRIGDAIHEDTLRGVLFTPDQKDQFEELEKVFDGLNVQFGLRAQGKLSYVETLIQEGKTWAEIGELIGWDPAAAKQFYELEKDAAG